MLPDDERHGTYAGASAHWKADVPMCEPCRAAAMRYHKQRKLNHLRGKSPLVPITGARRRIQALACLGHGFAAIANDLNASREQVRKWATSDNFTHITAANHEAIDAVYQARSMELPEPTTRGDRRAVTLIRNLARRNGWKPPLMWDDIDRDSDNNADDFIHEGGSIDEVLVDRVLAGDSAAHKEATAAERHEVIARWAASGRSLRLLEQQTGWNVWRDLRSAAA